ncbi:hypothetical protein [Halegenticoccus soli]|uniref:hypothetical protein n=1 Tax=Halegenticoccus soli TaxID=1985678 RepID=UPI000C6D0117|nr:hypothetical protein [Halegenticoccus soli]
MVEANVVQILMDLLRDQGLSVGEAIQHLRELGIDVRDIQTLLHRYDLSVGEVIQLLRRG